VLLKEASEQPVAKQRKLGSVASPSVVGKGSAYMFTVVKDKLTRKGYVYHFTNRALYTICM